VTTYNQGRYIEDTLRSVFAQTYSPFEVIVVDDGSTDDTPDRIATFGDKIIYVRQPNKGIAASRNTGIRKAGGQFIAFLDGDDLWEPEKLSVQTREANNHPYSGLIAVDGIEFNDAGTTESTLFFAPFCKDFRENTTATGSYYRELLKGPFISTTSQVMVPSKVFEKVGLSDEQFPRASDYDLYIRIAAKFEFTIIKEPLVRWRCSPSSASGPKNLRPFRYLPEDIAILRNHLPRCALSVRSLIERTLEQKILRGAERLYYYGLNENRIKATAELLRLLRVSPVRLRIAAFLAGLWCPRVLGDVLRRPVRTMVAGDKNHLLP
jgi:glycosyltransferase involved in cell wall biosynthesis